MELNPNHRTTAAVHDMWHKIAALLVRRYVGDSDQPLVITEAELHAFAEGDRRAITIRFVDGQGIVLGLVDEASARRLARKEGGLPS